MKTRFDTWWMRVKLPWWCFRDPDMNHNIQSDIRQMCEKAYVLGRKHMRQQMKAEVGTIWGTES
jgi:hypothetical protein